MLDAAESETAMQLVDGWLSAWAKKDLEGMKAVSSDDFIQWHSTMRKDFTKTEQFAMLEQAIKAITINFHDIKRYPVQGGAVQQCLGDITLSNGAEAKNVPFAMVFRVRDGKIVRCDEYMDANSLPKMDFLPA